MGLSSLLEKAHITSKPNTSEGPSDQPSATLAPNQGDAKDESDESSDDEEEAPKDADSRTYTIVIENKTTFPIQVVAWPARASKAAEYALTTYRGAKKHTSVPSPSGTIFTDALVHLATTRGPRSLDFRERWVWIYVDVVTPRRKVHCQIFVRLGRKGVLEAKLGRTDLDSTKDSPCSSGELGQGVVDVEKKEVKFNLGEELAEVENVTDDTMEKRGLTDVRGKGIETNTYMSLTGGKVSVVVGSEARYHEYGDPVHPNRLATLKSSRHRIDGVKSRSVAVFVERHGEQYFKGHVHVHPITGISTGKGFDSTRDSVAIFAPNGDTLCYGWHDAGEGRRSQVYLYATPPHASWLGELIDSNSDWLSKPFSTLALAAAHDAGMIYAEELHGGLATLIQEGQFGNALKNAMITHIAAPTVRVLVDCLEAFKLSPTRVISNIAMTQKDSVLDMLKIGTRFFDFRPGYCFHDVIHLKKDLIHHQHALVPGCTYLEFLTSILDFLASHPSEIVVVELKSDGFVILKDVYRDGKLVVYSMIPTEAELAEILEQARRAAQSDEARGIVVTGAAAMARPIGELISERRRLILIDKIHRPDEWERGDSYDHVAYNTDTPETIIAALEKTHAESSKPDAAHGEERPPRGCIYQLQATPTANLVDDLFASLTYSDSSSLLTWVKPMMDRVTYPWLHDHDFHEPGNVILLNDFVEGVLVEHAIDISKRRARL